MTKIPESYRLGYNPKAIDDLRRYYNFIVDELDTWKDRCKHKQERTKDEHRDRKPCRHLPSECIYKRYVIEERRINRASIVFKNNRDMPFTNIMSYVRSLKDKSFDGAGAWKLS